MHPALHALISAPILRFELHLINNRILKRRIYAIKWALTAPAGRERVRALTSSHLEQSVRGYLWAFRGEAEAAIQSCKPQAC